MADPGRPTVSGEIQLWLPQQGAPGISARAGEAVRRMAMAIKSKVGFMTILRASKEALTAEPAPLLDGPLVLSGSTRNAPARSDLPPKREADRRRRPSHPPTCPRSCPRERRRSRSAQPCGPLDRGLAGAVLERDGAG